MTNEIQDFIQSPLDKPGIFRGYPVAWTVEESTKQDSHSVAIAFQFAVHQEWVPASEGADAMWSQDWPVGWYVENRTWVVKVDGTINAPAVENLKKCALWNGDWDKLSELPPSAMVHLDVQEEMYEGKPQIRANWINQDADVPQARRGFAPVESGVLDQMRKRFGAQTKAIGGGQPAGGSPAAPPSATPGPLATPGAPAAAHAAAPAPTVPATPAAPTPPPPSSPPIQGQADSRLVHPGTPGLPKVDKKRPPF